MGGSAGKLDEAAVDDPVGDDPAGDTAGETTSGGRAPAEPPRVAVCEPADAGEDAVADGAGCGAAPVEAAGAHPPTTAPLRRRKLDALRSSKCIYGKDIRVLS
jgi:hypothetical protein